MYPLVLTLHSWLRWIVILLGVWTVVSALRASAADRTRSPASSAMPGMFFTLAIDVQLLLGLLLYVALSPITTLAMTNVGEAMQNPAWRYWLAEHPFAMLLGVLFAHVARVIARKRGVSRAVLVWYALALAAVLLASPWPFMSQGRALFRF